MITLDVLRQNKAWLEEEIALASKAARAAVAMGSSTRAGGTGEVSLSLVFATQDFVQDLNARFRKVDRPTNVLAFPSGEIAPEDKKTLLGDVIMAREVLLREAGDKKIKPAVHAAHLAAHGTLHLLGFTHEENAEAEEMESLEIKVLQSLGIENPYKEDENV